MTPNMERGARIIIHEWVRVKAWDKVLIVTSKEHQAEAKALEMQARKKARSVNTLIVENKGRHVGIFFDDNEAVFDPYTAIIAATEYSLDVYKRQSRESARYCFRRFLSTTMRSLWRASVSAVFRRASRSRFTSSARSTRKNSSSCVPRFLTREAI